MNTEYSTAKEPKRTLFFLGKGLKEEYIWSEVVYFKEDISPTDPKMK